MNHRHLLPDEIDLLLDGEEGFGVAPLQEHIDSCASCGAELERARKVVFALERLPHFSPSPLFPERVMAQVQVFEPWHVAALDSLRRFVPQTTGVRVLAGALASSVAMVLSIGALWVASRADAAVFVMDVGFQRLRALIVEGAAGAMTSAFGAPALDALRASGASGIAIGALSFSALLVVAAFGLRAIAASARRRRA